MGLRKPEDVPLFSFFSDIPDDSNSLSPSLGLRRPPQRSLPPLSSQPPREALSVESLLPNVAAAAAAAAAAPHPAAASSSASSQDERAPLRSADGGGAAAAAAAAAVAAVPGAAPGPNNNTSNSQLEYTVGEAIDKIGELKRVEERGSLLPFLPSSPSSLFAHLVNKKKNVFFKQASPPSTSSSSSSPGPSGWPTPWR